jgi:cytochrome P450
MDPEIFPEPETFNPDRWMQGERLDRYLTSFSKGSRGCVGIK